MRLGLLAAAIAAAGSAHAAEWVVDAHYADTAMLARAGAHTQHLIVDAKNRRVRTSTDDAGIRQLQDDGLDVHVDTVASAKLAAFTRGLAQAKSAGGGVDSIPGFECYRTVEETYSTMDTLRADHPDIVAIDEIGPTWEKQQNAADGYTMRALRITQLATAADDPARPKMVVFTSIHAREYAPAELGTRFAEWLVNNYGRDAEATWLVDHNDFRLVLQANPDGRKKAETGLYWRKNTDTINGTCNGDPQSDGVDLNRNFPFHWNITHGEGSSGARCDETYRGPVLQSEPETQNLVGYVAGTCDAAGACTGGVFADRRSGSMNPAGGSDDGDAAPEDTSGFFIDIHSNAALVLWPWGDTSSAAPNQAAMRTLGRRLAYFNGYTPEQSDSLYPTDGTTDDTMYGLLGVPGFTIETDGNDFFEDCASFDGDTAPSNIAALRYVARALHATYQLPAGPDTIAAAASSDLVATGDPIGITAALDGTRFNQSTQSDGVPGAIYSIASANAYVDALPWQSGAQAIALAAVDGAFDSAKETVGATIDGGAITAGRHLVFVQGTDAQGHAGTLNAALIDVVDAASVGTLRGSVRDRATASPLAATIALTAGTQSHSAVSDAATGRYVAHGYPDTFAVHVSAPHHLAEDLAGVTLAAGASVSHDFSLYPNCTVLSDDVESGNHEWTAQSPWTIVADVPGNATHVWNTPNYGDGLDASLTSAAHNLTGYADISLDFDDRCATEPGYDFGYVEFRAGATGAWTTLYRCSGQSDWQSHHVDLPAAANGAAALQVRFRLDSDSGVNAAGWAVDNIRMEAGGDACRAQQPPDDTIFANGFDAG